MFAASRLVTRLNRDTAVHHGIVDEGQLAILDDPTPARYRDFLARTYGFEAAVESSLAWCPKIDQVIDLRIHAKAGLLAADLLALGLRPSELARVALCKGIEPCDAISDVIGWLYVVERKTFLHDPLVFHLEIRMPEVIDAAGSFLRCYRDATDARWRQLGATFDRVATPEMYDRIEATAHRAFRVQHDWFSDMYETPRVQSAWARPLPGRVGLTHRRRVLEQSDRPDRRR